VLHIKYYCALIKLGGRYFVFNKISSALVIENSSRHLENMREIFCRDRDVLIFFFSPAE